MTCRLVGLYLTNAAMLLIVPLGTINILFKKIHLKMSSGKWRPFCLSLSALIYSKPEHEVGCFTLIMSIRITTPNEVDEWIECGISSISNQCAVCGGRGSAKTGNICLGSGTNRGWDTRMEWPSRWCWGSLVCNVFIVSLLIVKKNISLRYGSIYFSLQLNVTDLNCGGICIFDVIFKHLFFF